MTLEARVVELERELGSLRARVASLETNVHDDGQLWPTVRDHAQRFDTLETSLARRIVFRMDGWPGQRNLNAERPSWRPWRRWWTS